MRQLGIMGASLLIAASALPAAEAQTMPSAEASPPTWSEFRQTAEAGVRARLVDPDSARIEWLGGFYRGRYKPMLEPGVTGFIGCGTVNARNRMGGYNGATSFVVVVEYGRVIYADLDQPSGRMVAGQCGKALRTGLLPPVPIEAAESSTSPSSSTPASASSTGLTLLAMPDGAYVSDVAPGSPAASAGIKSGMVIAAVNGIPLGGMGPAMLKVLDAAGTRAALSLVGGRSLTLGGTP